MFLAMENIFTGSLDGITMLYAVLCHKLKLGEQF